MSLLQLILHNLKGSVIIIGIVGDDLIILPITTQILKKQKQDFDIQLEKPSVIQVGNIQSINKKHIIKQYYSKSNQSNSISHEMQK